MDKTRRPRSRTTGDRGERWSTREERQVVGGNYESSLSSCTAMRQQQIYSPGKRSKRSSSLIVSHELPPPSGPKRMVHNEADRQAHCLHGHCKPPADDLADLPSVSRCTTACLALALLIIMSLAFSLPGAHGVDCFKCTSRNGSNPACEDPFHNLNTTRTSSPVLPEPAPNVTYHTPCYAGKKGRDGLFPASACIKLIGTFETTGESLVVRHCALDSGTLTQDTELARMSHCGKFQFENDLLQGCVLACPEDACNSSPASLWNRSQSSALLLLPLMGPLLTSLASALTYASRHETSRH